MPLTPEFVRTLQAFGIVLQILNTSVVVNGHPYIAAILSAMIGGLQFSLQEAGIRMVPPPKPQEPPAN